MHSGIIYTSMHAIDLGVLNSIAIIMVDPIIVHNIRRMISTSPCQNLTIPRFGVCANSTFSSIVNILLSGPDTASVINIPPTKLALIIL